MTRVGAGVRAVQPARLADRLRSGHIPGTMASAASLPLITRPRPLALSNWLLLVAALVLAMVVVGGITRLTESGLSIVKWEPVAGALPPLNDAQWQAEFAAYRASPQYQLVN